MDHYSTLGVAKNATIDEIKKAYRKLASQHHPDKGGDTATFQKIQSAYETLSDPDKKQQYDNPGFGNPNGMPNGFPGGFHFHSDTFDINDIIGQMFGMGRQHHQTRTQIFRTIVSVSLDDAFNGSKHTLKIQSPMGTKFVSIDIPRGVNNGDQVRYDGVLDQNTSLMVEFRIAPHLKFERNGNDLYSSQMVSVLDLIAGSVFEFTTISGKTLEVKIPPMTQPHMHLKISGQGMPIRNSNQFGDQIILIKPFIPDNISDDIVQSILRSRQTT